MCHEVCFILDGTGIAKSTQVSIYLFSESAWFLTWIIMFRVFNIWWISLSLSLSLPLSLSLSTTNAKKYVYQFEKRTRKLYTNKLIEIVISVHLYIQFCE